MANYLEDDDLYYELVLSKGLGYLTNNANKYFIRMAKKIMEKKAGSYKGDDQYDCQQNGILMLLSSWKTFDDRKYKTAFPYATEVFKRGMAAGYNEIMNKKSYHKEKITMISIDRCNDSKGFYTF